MVFGEYIAILLLMLMICGDNGGSMSFTGDEPGPSITRKFQEALNLIRGLRNTNNSQNLKYN